jgi:hypothetical protein
MAIADRVKNICLTPTTEWPVIAQESATTTDLVTGYVAPLAAIGAVAGFIGGSVIGRTVPFVGTFRTPLVWGLGGAIFAFIAAVVGVLICAFIVNALAPTFGGEKNSTQAMKVAVYSFTPAWVAGVLNILPLLGILAIFAALYGIYLLYLGLPVLMKSPPDKAIGYTVVTVICVIVVQVVLAAVGGAIIGAGMIGSGALGGLSSGIGGGLSSSPSSSEVVIDKNSTLGKLQEFSKKMEESGKKIDAANRAGDTGAAASAATEALGALLGGGKHVDPIGIDQLKPFVPDTFAGLPKRSSNAEKTGIANLMVSKAEARYSDGANKSVELDISDSGGASGLMGLASWVGVQGEKDDDNATERTTKVGGRLVHERMAKQPGGSNEFGIVLGERFFVNARGNGVSLDELKAAVSSLDLARLEAMKDVGVK